MRKIQISTKKPNPFKNRQTAKILQNFCHSGNSSNVNNNKSEKNCENELSSLKSSMITMSSLRKPLGLLIDLSGTIHIEDQAIKGSIEAVNLLRRQKVPFLFVTNTTKVSKE